MANIGKKSEYSGRQKFRVWDYHSIEKYGENFYHLTIDTILRKRREVGHEFEDDKTVKVLMEHYYQDKRRSVRYFRAAHLFIKKLRPNSISLLFYLADNLFENLNLSGIKDRKECYRFCGMDEEARINVEEAINNGKVYKDVEKEINVRCTRFLRNAVKDLIDNNVIQVTSVKDYYWVNPKVVIKGDVGKIPAKHNNYNLETLIHLNRNTYQYGGVCIYCISNTEFMVIHEGKENVFKDLEQSVEFIKQIKNE